MRLLNVLSIAVLLLLGRTTTNGKDAIKAGRLKAGLKAGVSASQFNKAIGPYAIPSNGFLADKRISAEAGILLRYKLSPVFHLQGEALINLKGMSYRKELSNRISYNLAGSSRSYYYNTFCLNYVEFPMMAGCNLTRLLLNKNARGGIILQSGIAPAYCYESSFKDDGKAQAWTAGSIEETVNAPGDFNYAKRAILNFSSELSFNSAVGHSNLFIYCRMTKTAGSVYKISSLDGLNLRTSMNSLSFGAGILF